MLRGRRPWPLQPAAAEYAYRNRLLVRARRRKRDLLFLTSVLLLMIVVLALAAAGCGSSTAQLSQAPKQDSRTATATAAKKWPDVPVTVQSVKTATAETLGYSISGTVPLVRTANVQESSPDHHYILTVEYNQPGACHGSSADWRVSVFELYGFRLLEVLFKQPAVDRVKIVTYALDTSVPSDQQHFEKIFQVVVSRDRTQGVVNWSSNDKSGAGSQVLPKIASEFWASPKARNDTGP